MHQLNRRDTHYYALVNHRTVQHGSTLQRREQRALQLRRTVMALGINVWSGQCTMQLD